MMYSLAYDWRSLRRLLRHRVDIAEEVVEPRHGPPKSELVREARRALETEHRSRRCGCCFVGFELVGREVARVVELLDFVAQRGERFLQLLRRRFALDGDRTDVIERVVVDADRVKQSAVDEPALKARARLIQHVGEDVGRVRRRGILLRARPLPLKHHDDGADRLLDDHRGVVRERRNRRNRVGRRTGSAPRFQSPKIAFASANAFAGAMSPVMMIAVLFGT